MVCAKKCPAIKIKSVNFWRLRTRMPFRDLKALITQALDNFNVKLYNSSAFQNNSDNMKRGIVFPGAFIKEKRELQYNQLGFKQRDTLIVQIIGNDPQFHFQEATEQQLQANLRASNSKVKKSTKKKAHKKKYQKAQQTIQVKCEKQNNRIITLHKITVPENNDSQCDDDQEFKLSKRVVNKKASVLGSGLNNLGNSCYMNASLQCLFHTKPFLNYFLLNEKNDKRDDSLIMKLTSRSRQAITIGQEFKELKLVPKFFEVMKELHDQNKPAISPLLFKRTCGLFDPQETSSVTLNNSSGFYQIAFKTNQNKKCPMLNRQSKSEYQSIYKLSIRLNPITESFHGELVSKIQCKDCQSSSQKLDPFLSLSLPVQEKRSFISLKIFELGKLLPRCFSLQYDYNQDSITNLDIFLKLHLQIQQNLLYFQYYDGNIIQQLESKRHLKIIHLDSEVLAYIIPQQFQNLFLPEFDSENQQQDKQQEEPNNNYRSLVKPKMQLKLSEDLCNNQQQKVQSFFLQIKHKGKLQSFPILCTSQLVGDNKQESLNEGENQSALYQQIVKELITNKLQQSLAQQSHPFLRDDLTPIKTQIPHEQHPPRMTNQNIKCTHKINASRKIQRCQMRNNLRIHRIDISSKFDVIDFIAQEDSEQLRISHCELTRAVSKIQSDDASLNDCFINFCRVEQLDDENLYNCAKCQRPTRAIKSIELAKIPHFLIIHLKRFTANRRKIERPIRFPLKNLQLQVSGGKIYRLDLYGVINHYGSLDRGHYTAMCKVRPRKDGVNDTQDVKGQEDQQKWVLFNDNSVTEIRESEINKKSAYVLFYKLNDEQIFANEEDQYDLLDN